MTIFVNGLTGNDANSGTTETTAKATLAAGFTAIKAQAADVNGDKFLKIAGGQRYTPPTALTWATANNAAGWVTIEGYGAEKPVICGGARLTGFTSAGLAGVYSVPYTGRPRGVWTASRRKLERASFAKTKKLQVTGAWAADGVLIDSTLIPSTEAMEDTNLEMVFPIGWTISYMRVNSIVSAGGGQHKVFFKFPDHVVENARTTRGPVHHTGQRFWFENALDFMEGSAGSWYADGTRLYISLPTGAASIAELEAEGIFAGNAERLFDFAGSNKFDPIRRLRLRNIRFENCDWAHPNSNGFVGWLPGHPLIYDSGSADLVSFGTMTEPVNVLYVAGIEVTGCEFVNHAAGGLRITQGDDVYVHDNLFHNIGGSAFLFRDGLPPEPVWPDVFQTYQLPKRILIEDNVVTDAGFTYTGSAISVNNAVGVDILNNTIRRAADDAIATGNGARTQGNWAGNVTVAWNYIDQAMQIAVDGGSIYSSSNFEGVVPDGVPEPHESKFNIFANYITNIRDPKYDPLGGQTPAIYLDLGSSGAWVRQNIIINCDLAFLENSSLYERFENNVLTNVTKEKFISYAGYSAYDPILGRFVSYRAPTEYPASQVSLDAFWGFGDYAGRGFVTRQPFTGANKVINADGTYNTLSLYRNNGPNAPRTRGTFGVSAEMAELYADYLKGRYI